MPLTEEQIKRMEENKRIALEKRAAAKNAQIQQNQNISTTNKQQPLNNNSKPTTTSSLTNFFASNSNKIQAKSSPFSDASKETGSSGAKVKAAFSLISRTRFLVNVTFHAGVVDAMKKMPSRNYDASTRKWDFALTDHDNLVQELQPLKSHVEIHPLPKYIVDTFRKAPLSRTITEADLSSLDPVISKTLLPFQKEGISYGIQRNGRILLADDMGLGKTIQSLALANYYKSDWPLLIVCPSSMKYAWSEAFRMWLPSIPLHHVQVLNTGKDYIEATPVTICSYDLLSRKSSDLERYRYGMLIFDESHLLKDQRTLRSKAAAALARSAKRVILLTGTPVLSRPIEIFSQICLLDSKAFPGFVQYGIRYCDGKQSKYGWDFAGASNLLELQLYLEEKYMIRRLKTEVLSQLPEKRRQMVVLDPSTIQGSTKTMQSKASQMQGHFSRPMEQRGALLSYYSETGKAKQRAVCDYVVDLLETGKKMLCFAHHRHVLEALAEAVGSRTKVKFILIDGMVSSEERKKLCDKFQADDTYRIALLSITAANTGLTLTAADLVVFAELFWNPGVLTQAEDRAHRIGQKDSVLVQYLVAKGTADDYLWPLVKRKLDILTEAGLSKENFNEAHTKHLTDPKQNDLTKYFELLSEETASPSPSTDSSEPQPKKAKQI